MIFQNNNFFSQEKNVNYVKKWNLLRVYSLFQRNLFINIVLSIPKQIQRGIAIVPRMRTPDHIRENFLLWDWNLSENDMQEIQALNQDNRLYLPLIEGRPWCSDHPHYPFKTNCI